MKKNKRISDSEWNIMRVVWDHPNLPASEVLTHLPSSLIWSQKTINTFLARLEKKGVIGASKIGRVKHYKACLSESECQRTESEFFLKKVFQGKVGPALLHFVENEELSADEMTKLRELINKPTNPTDNE